MIKSTCFKNRNIKEQIIMMKKKTKIFIQIFKKSIKTIKKRIIKNFQIKFKRKIKKMI